MKKVIKIIKILIMTIFVLFMFIFGFITIADSFIEEELPYNLSKVIVLPGILFLRLLKGNYVIAFMLALVFLAMMFVLYRQARKKGDKSLPVFILISLLLFLIILIYTFLEYFTDIDPSKLGIPKSADNTVNSNSVPSKDLK